MKRDRATGPARTSALSMFSAPCRRRGSWAQLALQHEPGTQRIHGAAVLRYGTGEHRFCQRVHGDDHHGRRERLPGLERRRRTSHRGLDQRWVRGRLRCRGKPTHQRRRYPDSQDRSIGRDQHHRRSPRGRPVGSGRCRSVEGDAGAVDPNGNLYVGADHQTRIVKVTPAGEVTHIAGTGRKATPETAGRPPGPRCTWNTLAWPSMPTATSTSLNTTTDESQVLSGPAATSLAGWKRVRAASS